MGSLNDKLFLLPAFPSSALPLLALPQRAYVSLLVVWELWYQCLSPVEPDLSLHVLLAREKRLDCALLKTVQVLLAGLCSLDLVSLPGPTIFVHGYYLVLLLLSKLLLSLNCL